MSELTNFIIDYELISEFEPALLEKHGVVPIVKDDFLLTVAATNEGCLEYLQNIYHLPLKVVTVQKSEIRFLLQELDIKQKIYSYALESVIHKESSTCVITSFLESLIGFAIAKRSSDIHIETQPNGVSVRLRIDGLLQHFFLFKKEFYTILSSVIKLLASLDITQKRKPQNGRFSQEVNGAKFDFRVSIMPTINGESIVIRILDTQTIQKKLDILGFQPSSLAQIKSVIHSTQGLILVTGPTGSGKTTTLYSILEEINSVNKKIITIEDPIEYHLPKVQQVPINHEIDLGFAQVLKDVLRQDPDCIMIGEIRDKESLKIALQASLTGHLVLATLHANDAVSTIDRLLDLEAEPYLVASTLKAVIAQRLVLKLCEKCKVKIQENEYKSAACEECNLTGFNGRFMLNEVLYMDEVIASKIAKSKATLEIREYLKKQNFLTMFDEGVKSAKEGKTTLQEVYKATRF